MKWFFLLVILLNAALFSWHSFKQESSGAAMEPVYAPPVSEKIQLLAETSQQEQEFPLSAGETKSSVEVALDKALANTAPQTSDLICPHIEIEKLEDKALIEKALIAQDWLYTTNENMGKRPKYWLYIPAPETPEMGRQIKKDLASKSIDSYKITRPELENRISLGLYSSEDRALQALERIKNLTGYDIQIYEHMRNVALQQIDITRPVSEVEWTEFLAQFDLSKMIIKIEKNSC